MVHKYRGIQIDKVAESHQHGGRREWLSYTVIGTQSAANAVLLEMVSHGLVWTF